MLPDYSLPCRHDKKKSIFFAQIIIRNSGIFIRFAQGYTSICLPNFMAIKLYICGFVKCVKENFGSQKNKEIKPNFEGLYSTNTYSEVTKVSSSYNARKNHVFLRRDLCMHFLVCRLSWLHDTLPCAAQCLHNCVSEL